MSCIVWTLPESTMEKETSSWSWYSHCYLLRGTAAHSTNTLSDNILNMKHRLMKKTLQNQAPKNCAVINHQNLPSLWSACIVSTLWIVTTSANLSSSAFLNNRTSNFQVFSLLCFSLCFSLVFWRGLFLRLAIGDFCFTCN